MSNEPDLQELERDVRRMIATAKIAEFEAQACRLGEYVRVQLIPAERASSLLYDAALANGLVREHGDDVIQALMAEGLR